MNKFLSILVVAMIIPPFLFTCTQQGIEWLYAGKSFTNSMVKPGETINDMVITVGVENAVPFWAYCSARKENDLSISADCGELPYANLGIGHTFGVMDLIPPTVEWEELNWEISLDGYPIDLEAFGVYEFVHPDFVGKPSPVSEVFKQSRHWNVVLVNPTLGMHRLQGQAQTRDGAETYTWVVNFTTVTPLELAFCY